MLTEVRFARHTVMPTWQVEKRNGPACSLWGEVRQILMTVETEASNRSEPPSSKLLGRQIAYHEWLVTLAGLKNNLRSQGQMSIISSDVQVMTKGYSAKQSKGLPDGKTPIGLISHVFQKQTRICIKVRILSVGLSASKSMGPPMRVVGFLQGRSERWCRKGRTVGCTEHRHACSKRRS